MLAILPTTIITTALLTAEHFAFRQEIRGRNLSRSQAYTMGTTTIAVPLSGLFIFWHYYPPATPAFLAALMAFWINTLVGGAVVVWLRHLMVVHNLRQQAMIAEAENEIHRATDLD